MINNNDTVQKLIVLQLAYPYNIPANQTDESQVVKKKFEDKEVAHKLAGAR